MGLEGVLPGGVQQVLKCSVKPHGNVVCHRSSATCVAGVTCQGALFSVDIGLVKVVDTHKNRFLGDCAPDLTVILQGYGISEFNAVLVIELQVGIFFEMIRGCLGEGITKGAFYLPRCVAHPIRVWLVNLWVIVI